MGLLSTCGTEPPVGVLVARRRWLSTVCRSDRYMPCAATLVVDQPTHRSVTRRTGSRVADRNTHPGATLATYRPLYPDKQSGDRGVLQDMHAQLVPPEWQPRETPIACAFYSEKGGVAKSSTVTGVAAVAAEAGARVLVVDLDPRGSATDELGIWVYDESDPEYPEREYKDRGVSYSVVGQFEDELTVNDILAQGPDELWGVDNQREFQAIYESGEDWPGNVFVLPAERLLGNRESTPQPGMERRLRLYLERAAGGFDLILIDMPPRAGGWLPATGIAAANQVLLPATLSTDGVDGIRHARQTLRLRRQGIGLPALPAVGVLRTMVRPQRSGVAEDADNRLWEMFGDDPHMPLLPDVVIPYLTVREEARNYNVPITASGDESGLRIRSAYARILRAMTSTAVS